MRKCILLIVGLLVLSFPALAQQGDEQLAAYYYDRGEYAQAAQLYENLYSRSSARFYYQRLLRAYTEQQRFSDARRLVEKRIKANPKELYLWVDQGNVYLAQKQEKKARQAYDRAIELITANLQPVPDLAQAFLSAGATDYAARTYLTAREKTRNRQLYFQELVGVYQQAGNYQAMIGEYFDLLDKQPAMLKSIQLSMQRSLQEAPDNRFADGVRSALVSRVQEQPQNRNYLEMMLWFSLQQEDFRFALEQAESVDARFADMQAEPVVRVARIAQSNGALDVAAEAYAYLRAKGTANPYYFESRVGELQVAFTALGGADSISQSSVADLASRYRAAIAELGRSDRTIPLMRAYSNLMAYHGGQPQEAVSTLDDILELPRLSPAVRDEVKLDLADLLLFAGQVWDASLLYMQVEKANKDDILGARAKFKNAKLSYFNHDFEWAVSQLRVLRASTSKLIANDAMELSLLISDNMDDDSTYTTLRLFADADLLLYRGMLDSAWLAFDAVAQSNLSHPLLDEVLMRKAQIRSRQGRYSEADSLLQRLISFYPFDITADDALMLRAELNEQHLARPDVAMECYERLLLDYPASLFVDQARKRYNILKAR